MWQDANYPLYILPHQMPSLWGFLLKHLSQEEDLFEVKIQEKQELEVQES